MAVIPKIRGSVGDVEKRTGKEKEREREKRRKGEGSPESPV